MGKNNKHLLELRKNKIKQLYKKYSEEKVNSKRKYRHEAILEMISPQVYLMPGTIENILSKTD